jgi:hypothetical protein
MMPLVDTKGIILESFPMVTFEWLFLEKKDIMLSVAQNLKAYHRFA